MENNWEIRQVEDPCQGHWLNFLPSLQGARLLKVGSRRLHLVKLLALRGPGLIDCVGSPPQAASLAAVAHWRSFEDLPQQFYDLVLLDELALLSSETHRRRFNHLKNLGDALQAGGTLAVFLSPGIRGLGLRFWFARSLARLRYAQVRAFLCFPRAEDPVLILPFSQHPAFVSAYASTWMTGKGEKLLLRGKRYLRRLAYRLLRTYNPSLGLLVLARKGPLAATDPATSSLVDHLETLASSRHPGSRVATISWTRRLEAKQVVLTYASDHHVAAVAKTAYGDHPQINALRRECENLAQLSGLAALWDGRKIAIPRLEHKESSPSHITFSACAVEGENLADLLRPLLYRGEREGERVSILVCQAAQLQMFLQDTLTSHLGTKLTVIDRGYFENYLGLPVQSSATARILAQFGSVQHGDFTTINLYLEPSTATWGVIDWEWLGAGYPPWFDLFSLLRSVGFSQERRPFKDQFACFVDTFFRDNWFSRLAREQVEAYRARYDLAVPLYDCFLMFLLFFCNKYRLNRFRLTDTIQSSQLSFYEKIARYAGENKQRFALGS